MKSGVYLEPELLDSQAFRELVRQKWAWPVFIRFYRKRRLRKVKSKNRKSQFEIINNGSITFTYEEAVSLLGLDKKYFTAAIDFLISLGFLEIVHQGVGPGDSSLFFISNRWIKFGSLDFQPPPKRRKSIRRPGWPAKRKVISSVDKLPLVQRDKLPLVKASTADNWWQIATGFIPSKLPHDVN